jgi:hypothetical protein
MKNLKESYVKQLRIVMENEIEQAEVLITAKSFARGMEPFIEKIGRMQNEDLVLVQDQMRETYGDEVANAFNAQIDSALQGVLTNMKEAQQAMSSAVNDIVQGRLPSGDMDMDMSDDSMNMDGSDDPLDAALDDLDMGDDFESQPAASGEEGEPLGRVKKESAQQLKARIEEARAIADKLRKVKEAKKAKQ